MTINFTCPKCGASSQIGDQYAGQTGPCAHCGEQISIPAAASKMSPPRDKRPAGGGGWAIAGIVVAVVGLMCCVAVVPVALMGGLLIPAVGQARFAARRAQCSNNMKQLGLATHNYHDVYSTMPTTTAGKDGDPLVSWRLHVTPFLEQQAIYEAYDQKETFDSPANSGLSSMALLTYICPEDPAALPNGTSYGAVFSRAEAPNPTLFVLDQPTRFRDVTDGLSNTIMFVESNGLVNSWAAPRDLQLDSLPMNINGPPGSTISSGHKGGANVVMADGSIRFLPVSINPGTLKNALMRADGNPVMLP